MMTDHTFGNCIGGVEAGFGVQGVKGPQSQGRQWNVERG